MDILEHKTVKIRKPHYCFTCSRKFEKGNYMVRNTTVDGNIFTSHMCMTCETLLRENRELFTEDGSIWEGTTIELMNQEGVDSPEELLEVLRKESS